MMIWSRAPFRITLAGGGTDLPTFYKKHGGVVATCAIDKYIYVGIRKHLFEDHVRVQYLDSEMVTTVAELKHSRARVALQQFGIEKCIEVVSVADLASKTGLGSSGAYLVALLSGLGKLTGRPQSVEDIANLACHLEMNVLEEPVGKQDQFIAAFGDMQKLSLDTTGQVEVTPLKISADTRHDIAKNCRMYYTRVQRNASEILSDQKKSIETDDSAMRNILQIGFDSIKSLEAGDVNTYGALMDAHWREKKKLSKKMAPSGTDELYVELLKSGDVLGGKIVGAGGGGFFLLYVAKNHSKVDSFMESRGFSRMDWSINTSGVQTANW